MTNRDSIASGSELVRPQLKSYSLDSGNDSITLYQDAGVEITLSNPDGQVLALLDLLDGKRTTAELTASMAARWPTLAAEDISAAIRTLDEAGMLENGAATTTLSAWQQERYFSNLAFFGTFASLEQSRYSFQEQLCRSHVVLLGVGGLGSTLLLNLAALGVGRITVLDHDNVELKNLSRQFLYSEAEVGMPKLSRAVARASSFNSEIQLIPIERHVAEPEDIAPLLPGADLVLSAIDQPSQVVQYWVNQACAEAGVPFITGGMQIGRGLYYSVIPGQTGCLECFRIAQQREQVETPDTTYRKRVNRGIGPVASLLGALVGLETVRYLTGFAPPISAGTLWLVDFATGQQEAALEYPKLADCPVCGTLAAASEAAPGAVAAGAAR